MTNRREFLKKAGAVLATISVAPVFAATDAKKLNIILINMDDLGWTDLGCFGSQYYETPNIDKLCVRGMKFTNAYAACAVCSPTRAAIMTGRYPARIGITDWIRAEFQGGRIVGGKNPTGYNKSRDLLCPKNHMFLEHSDVTIAELLKPIGYTTCHIGKWHLGPEQWYPETQGFDFNHGGCDYGQPPSYFDPYKNRKCQNIPTLPPRKQGEYLTDREAGEAVSFIRRHKDRPFFLHMAHYAVHTPIQAKADLKAKYENRAKTTKQENAAYAAMVHSVDDAVGRIVATLDNLALSKHTMIIFTSDNGGLLGPTDNTPLRQGKGHPYEGGIRIPQIICWPGVVKPGTVCKDPVISVDFFPTIAEATLSAMPNRAIDGESLIPLLKQSGSLKRDSIFWHFPHYRGRIAPYSIIRSGKWKLLKRYAGKQHELFNLESDISEKNDLSKTMPEKVTELDTTLTKWLKGVGAKMPKPVS